MGLLSFKESITVNIYTQLMFYHQLLLFLSKTLFNIYF